MGRQVSEAKALSGGFNKGEGWWVGKGTIHSGKSDSQTEPKFLTTVPQQVPSFLLQFNNWDRKWFRKKLEKVQAAFLSQVTQILSAIEQGDPKAAGQLLTLVHDELRRLAAQ